MMIMMLMAALMIGFTTVVTSDQRYRVIDRDRVKAFYGALSGLEKLNTDLAQDISQRQLTKWAIDKAPELMEMRDDGTAFLPPQNFNEAARRSGLGQTFKTQMLEQIAATAGAFETGQKLLPLLTPENVGVRGAVSRLKDAAIGQINPNMKTGTSSEMLATSKAFMAGLVRALRSDGNSNE